MISVLQQRERANLAETLSRQMNAAYMPNEPGSRVSGVYERSISTPSGRLAVIRREDTFKLAPWNAALEPMRGQMVIGSRGAPACDVDTRSRARPARTRVNAHVDELGSV